MAAIQELSCQICKDFVAKSPQGLASHTRACVAKNEPPVENIGEWALQSAVNLANKRIPLELIEEGEELHTRAYLFQSYRKRYLEIKDDFPTMEKLREYLLAEDGHYAWLYGTMDSINKAVIGRDPAGQIWGKGHNDSTHMKDYDAYKSKVAEQMRAIEEEAWEDVKVMIFRAVQRELPDKEVRNLVLESEQLFSEQSKEAANG
jgi:hypothetical protein